MPLIDRGRAAVLLVALAGSVPLLAAAKSGGTGGVSLAAEQRPNAADQDGAAPDDATLERRTLQRTLENVPSGESGRWRNPGSGDAGSITPLVTYRTTAGQFCREFQESITAATRTRQSRQTACRTPDGRWEIVHDE